LDNGQPFKLEDFQLEQAEDIFAGFQEIWIVQPEGNGKTTFLGLLALYHLDYTPSAFVPIGAAAREQAEIMYRQAEGFVLRTPGLRDRFKCQEGYRRIKGLRTGGRIQVYASDEKTADGVIPSLALVDEPHRHKNLGLYRTWKGKLEKRGGQIVAISTAGEPNSEFEETRERIHLTATDVRRNGCHVRAAGEDIVLHDWAVPDRSSAQDMAVVAAANPRAAITAEVLRKKHDSPTMTPEHWLRFVCNIPTRMSGQPITPDVWDPLRVEGPVDRSLTAYGFMDLGWKIDTTGVGALLWESPQRQYVTQTTEIQPPVDEADIVVALLRLQERFPRLRGIVYDPNAGGQQMVQLLEKGQHPLQTDSGAREAKGLPALDGPAKPLRFIEHSQDNAPMSLAATRLDEAIRGSATRPATLRWVADGDWEALRRHAFNAVRKDLGGEKWRFDRPSDAKGRKRASYPIDLLSGLLFALNTALGERGKRVKPRFEVLA